LEVSKKWAAGHSELFPIDTVIIRSEQEDPDENKNGRDRLWGDDQGVPRTIPSATSDV